MNIISVSIDVKQLDKARFKKHTKKDGTEALYAELVLIETPNGQYGDFMVKQSVTKEERLAKKQMPILGNGKYVGGGNKAPADKSVEEQDTDLPADDVPF